MALTVQQAAAVENRGGSLLVSAAAGSGKTKVLVERLFRYVEEEGHSIDAFLMITYTKAAAAELRSKIAAELSHRMAQRGGDNHLKQQLLRVYRADIKTVDAFCTALLRENTHLLPKESALTPDFRVLDENEASLIRTRVLGRTLEAFYQNLTPEAELLADTLGAGRDDRALEALVLETYEKLQSHADPEGWLEKSQKAWEQLGGTFDETVYCQALLQAVGRKAAHFGALLSSAARSVQTDEALQKGYGEKFLTASATLEHLSQAETWEESRSRLSQVEFPRLSTPKGRKDDGDVVRLKRIWDNTKEGVKKLSGLLEVSAQGAMEDLTAVAPAMTALLKLTRAFQENYRREKSRRNAADFSDQEHLALKLLVGADGAATALGQQVAGRYVEIMVDEYQDTNEIQNAIFQAVSREGQNLFTVGDVKQSIYRFRLADPTIFLGKYNRFKAYTEAQPGEERKILLSRNFRSRREILDAANFIFENILSPEMGEMVYGEDEALHFGAEYYPPREDCATEFHLIALQRGGGVKKAEAEARFVAKRIRELLDQGCQVTDGEGLRPCKSEDIVILMRSPGSRMATFAKALSQQGIPCSFEDGGDFFATMEISVVMALLEIVDNPRQDVPLISVLRSPVFGFSADRLAMIRLADREGDFYDALQADGGEDCKAFLETLGTLRQAGQDMSVFQLLWAIYDQLNLLGMFGAMEGGALRRENLIAFTRHAEKFEQNGIRGLFAFVSQLRRMVESGETPATKASSAVSGVQLMSIHKSKGLEFPIVFLCDLDHAFSRQDFDTPVLVHPEMGLGPRRVDLQRRIKYPTLARLAVEETLRRENLAEEQRILYVAMTRPKEKLILVDAMYAAAGTLQKLCALAECPVRPETVAEGKNFGQWILLPLLCRSEAAPLRAYAGAEVEGRYEGDTAPWEVTLHENVEEAGAVREGAEESKEEVREMAFDPALLRFVYPYQEETILPAKVTATSLKGRLLDREAAEHAAHTPYLRPLSQPRSLQEDRGLLPAERGTATHLVLQYLDFGNLDVAGQMEQMCREVRITPQQAAAVDQEALARLLRSPLAEEIRRSPRLYREYPFTVLMDARRYAPQAAEGDTILLQGVVDCCYEGEDGLVVVDFKTDHVFSKDEIAARAEGYRSQIMAYSEALEQVLERPVSRRYLYFIPAGKLVEVESEKI